MKSTKSADASVAISVLTTQITKNFRVTGLFRLQSWKPKGSRSISATLGMTKSGYPWREKGICLFPSLRNSHSCSLSLALTIHFLLTFGARKTYSQLLQMHRLQCSTEPQLGHTFVNAIKRGRGNVESRHTMNINKQMVAYSNHDRCSVAALLIVLLALSWHH